MSRARRVVIGFVLLLALMLALNATGAPLWLRVIGLLAGAVVWYRWLWRYGGWRDDMRESVRKAREKAGKRDS